MAKDDVNVSASLAEIAPADSITLGKTIEKVTESWFAPKEAISKLLIAILYEDKVEEHLINPPEGALLELEKIRDLLGLRSEKSKQSGVFEEVE